MDIHNLNTFSLAGVDLLDAVQGFPRVRLPNELRDVSRITRRGKSQQNTKRELELSFDAKSDIGSGVYVSHLSVGAFLLDGTSMMPTLRGLSVKGSYDSSLLPTISSLWRSRRNRRKLYDLEARIGMPDTGGLALALQGFSGTITDQKMGFAVTLNGTVYSIPIIVREWEIGDEDGEQVLWVRGDGDDPGTGDYPVSPTTALTLLNMAMNAIDTPLALVLQTGAAADGWDIAGNLKWDSFSFDVADEEIIGISYGLKSHGTMTGVVAV